MQTYKEIAWDFISWFRGTEQELLSDKSFISIREVNQMLLDNGYCYVRVTGGDYDGSIAKFTPDFVTEQSKMYRGTWEKGVYAVVNHWQGRLSWEGKKNNPQFVLSDRSAVVIKDDNVETLLKRFDLKAESAKLLDNPDIQDISGNTLNVGDSILYMNLRYGSGGKLCFGKIKEFKAHARQGYVSVIVSSDEDGQLSDLNYPHQQIYKVTNKED